MTYLDGLKRAAKILKDKPGELEIMREIQKEILLGVGQVGNNWEDQKQMVDNLRFQASRARDFELPVFADAFEDAIKYIAELEERLDPKEPTPENIAYMDEIHAAFSYQQACPVCFSRNIREDDHSITCLDCKDTYNKKLSK